MDILTATKDFEKWVSSHTQVVKAQLSDKHRQMEKSPVQFLRGTFYRWTQMFPEICPDLGKAPTVLSVGDLHIASFGTWRDGFGRLIWGIDDFDEAYPLPYTNDLVRLAVSAILDASEGEIKVGLGNVVDVILDGYRTCLRRGGEPFVLEEKHKWLRKIALDCLDIPANFWKKMDVLPAARTSVLRTREKRSPAFCRLRNSPTGSFAALPASEAWGTTVMWLSPTGRADRSPWRPRPRYHPRVIGRGPLERRKFTTSSCWSRLFAVRTPSCA
jgi:hypothetical protein